MKKKRNFIYIDSNYENAKENTQDENTIWLYCVSLFLMISCQRNTSEVISIDKVITFSYECEEPIGIVVESENERNDLEVSGEYTKTTISGLKDRCPDNGNGCNPYSCQEVPLILNLITG